MYKHESIIRKRKPNGKYQTILPNTRIFAEYDDTGIPAKILLNITASDLTQAKQAIEPGIHFITLFGGPYAGRDFSITQIEYLPAPPHRLILSVTLIQSDFVTDGYTEGVVKELHPAKSKITVIHCQRTNKEEN